jgi:hypothetical protein
MKLFFPNEQETAPRPTEFIEETKDEMWCRLWAEAEANALKASTKKAQK